MIRPLLLGRRDADAAKTFYVLTAVSTLCFSLSFTLNIVYMATTVGLNVFELVLVGTVLELTCFLLEVPTGVVADLYSRRLSVLIGLVLIGIGLFLQGAIPLFGAILVAQVLWGAGTTFTSGATEAWIADELGEERLDHVFTRNQQIHLAAAIVGICGAGALALIDIRLPMLCSGIGFLLLAVVLWRVMPERNFQPTPREDRSTVAHLVATAREGLALARRRRVVRSILLVTLFVGLSSEAFDRLWQLRLLQQYSLPSWGGTEPYVLFALIELAGVFIALVCSLVISRLGAEKLNAAHPHRVLAVLAAVQVAGIATLALTGWLGLALAAVWLKAAAMALAAPVSAAWMNRNLEPGVRATVLSFQSQANALGQVAGGPPLGVLGQRTSVSVALLGSAALLLPTVGIFARLKPDQIARPEPADPSELLEQRPHRLIPRESHREEGRGDV